MGPKTAYSALWDRATTADTTAPAAATDDSSLKERSAFVALSNAALAVLTA
jgi:hypothetical protein